MYANQTCSPIQRAFGKRERLNRWKTNPMAALMHWMDLALIMANGFHGGDRAFSDSRDRSNRSNRFFSLDPAGELLHSENSSESRSAALSSNVLFAFSLVRCVANLLTLLFST
jgi:hypothetical protein